MSHISRLLIPQLLGGSVLALAVLFTLSGAGFLFSIAPASAASVSPGRGTPARYQQGQDPLAGSLSESSGATDQAQLPRSSRGFSTVQVPAPTPDFQDVPTTNPFYSFLHNIYAAGIVGGYNCGGPGEPCGNPPLPYYRPNNNVTRSQMTKFVDLARHAPGFAISTLDSPLPLTSDSDAPTGTGLYGTTAGTGTGRSIDQVNAGVAGYAFGPSSATSGSVGVVAYSASDNGAMVSTGALSNTYGLYVVQGGALFSAGNSTIGNTVFISGALTVTGPKTGYVVDIMRNVGAADIHPGDVAVVGAASGPAQIGEIPVAGAVSGHTAYDTGVLGVVDMRWIPGDPGASAGTAARTGGYDAHALVIHPGEYMGVVTLGLYKGVRADAGNGPIHVGDLLTTSTTAGATMKASDKLAAFGAIVGKAMGDLASGTGTIPVLVMLR